ncbi:MAG: RpiB/LacA/LacB family sugar-phosphate isomerase [Candidatus Paceibacterota bacterium]
MMKIYLATDHAGFAIKEEIKRSLTEGGFEVEDCGAHEYTESDDYPDFIALAARAVSIDSENTRAIILGGSGQGEAMLANKFPNVRAALFYGLSGEIATLSREHNDANVLSLGARFVTKEEAKRIVKVWLHTEFSKEERHVRRLDKIKKIEKNLYLL